MEKDFLGNDINVGDLVLVKESDKDTTYRQAIIRAFREDNFDCRAGTIQIEYIDGRLYCNIAWCYLEENKDKIEFHTKPVKVWVQRTRVLKFKPEYING